MAVGQKEVAVWFQEDQYSIPVHTNSLQVLVLTQKSHFRGELHTHPVVRCLGSEAIEYVDDSVL